MDTKLRKRIGARLLAERVQVKNWNELKAARAAKIEPQTVRRIERGLNYEFESLEKYAAGLGKPIDDWLWEILSEGRLHRPEQEAQRRGAGAFPPTGSDRPERERS